MFRGEPIKVWREDGFTLALWDTDRRDWRGQTRLAYKLWDNGKLIFEGEDFSGSPMHADDSDMTVASLLSFLSLGEHDTDEEYFERYTPAQIEWRDSHRREQLSYLQFDFEEQATNEWKKTH